MWTDQTMAKKPDQRPETYVAPSRAGKVNLAIWTDPERRQRLKVLAAMSGESAAEIIERALDREMDRMEKKK